VVIFLKFPTLQAYIDNLQAIGFIPGMGAKEISNLGWGKGQFAFFGIVRFGENCDVVEICSVPIPD
jgi:hypothetical protein